MASLGRLTGTARIALAAALLFAHARRYDVLCDDAFISLRYARNLAEGHGLVYNAGERVEGFTNFLWVLAEALLLRLGASPRLAVDVLGFLTALAAAYVVERGAERLELRPVGRLVAHAAVVSSVSFAVWLLAGLEASAYGVLVLGVFVSADEAISSDTPWRHGAVVAGLVASAAMLLRPETPLVVACAAVAALLVARERAVMPLLRAGVTFATVVGPLLVARRLYYDDWLPNTFYLKTTGDGAALLEQGKRYVAYAVKHHGVLLGLALAGVLVVARAPRTRAFGLAAALFVSGYGLYVARVGGDFLPATRFFAPLVPLLALLAGFVVQELGLRVPEALPRAVHRGARGVVAGVAASLLMAPQLEWSRTVGVEHEPEERALHIEPLQWTRLYGLRWSALGRWIAAHAKEGDGMAMGAAGAAPYYAGSGVSNLDILGLCDRYVAREGIVVGSRPGHQRRSPVAYTLAKRPVFLFEGDYDSEVAPSLQRDATWESRGYTWAAARVDAERYEAPSTFWWVFLLRRDRADELRGTPDLALAMDELN
jgi:arabinofuranosyltransferase